jgi:hypothetical protein
MQTPTFKMLCYSISAQLSLKILAFSHFLAPLLEVRVDFNDGAGVCRLREHEVVCHTKRQNHSRDNDSEVHLRERDVIGSRPATEEYNEKQVTDGDNVVGNAKCTFKLPWSPGEASVVGLVDLARAEDGHGGVWVVQVATHSPPEQKTNSE